MLHNEIWILSWVALCSSAKKLIFCLLDLRTFFTISKQVFFWLPFHKLHLCGVSGTSSAQLLPPEECKALVSSLE